MLRFDIAAYYEFTRVYRRGREVNFSARSIREKREEKEEKEEENASARRLTAARRTRSSLGR